jgi:hypothetical protein
MSRGTLFNCFSSTAITGRDFKVIYFIGSREVFQSKVGIYPNEESVGTAGCVDEKKDTLYVLLDDEDFVDSAREFIRRLIVLNVSCLRTKVATLPNSSEKLRRKVKGMVEALIAISLFGSSDDDST